METPEFDAKVALVSPNFISVHTSLIFIQLTLILDSERLKPKNLLFVEVAKLLVEVPSCILE